jgi:nucleoside phosphorylase
VQQEIIDDVFARIAYRAAVRKAATREEAAALQLLRAAVEAFERSGIVTPERAAATLMFARMAKPAQSVLDSAADQRGHVEDSGARGVITVSEALATWRRKLDNLQQQEAVVADAAQKYALAVQIREAKARIEELETSPPRSSSAPHEPRLVRAEVGVSRPRVYLSYTLRTPGLRDRVFELAEKLRANGIDSRLDRYYGESLHGFSPPDPLPDRDSWEAWQEDEIRSADCVLVVCSKEFNESPEGSGVWRDVQFMKRDLDSRRAALRKFIPVGFGAYEANKQFIPSFIRGATYYDLTPATSTGFGFDDLIRRFRTEFPRENEAIESSSSPKPSASRKRRKPEGTSIMQPPVDFVVITPLEEERQAMLAHLGSPKRVPPTHDDVRVYYPVSLPITFTEESKGSYKIVLTDLLGMGRLEAANAVGDAIRRWRPKYVVLVGIAGGLAKAGVSLGDVLISEQIADYELQKLTTDKTEIRWSVHRADPRLLAAAKQLRPTDWRPLIHETRPEPGQSQRHAGPICTGDKVIANGLMDQYRDVWTKLIGVEMEAGGVAGAASQAPNAPGFFMVRGVSDLADAGKDEPRTHSWRAYACDVAAAYMLAFLKSGPVPGTRTGARR